ncbi:MAG: tripartite tricarboxylate transporter substrate binding protein [Burkholderiales bacterium]|nr:tripartite tricarboxylate transporter substrate binding protein [Burkholderiales bacterium]
MCRRFIVLCGLALAALAGPAGAQGQAQAYPAKPVRIIVGFPPGTGPDIVARLLAQKLSQAWNNQAVVVDNKPGAGGVIAAAEAAHASPDGYTLMLGETGQLSIAPNSYSRLSYDAKKDFIPVSQVVTSDFTLLLNPLKVPARDVKQFVAWARQQNGLFMGSFGAGTPGHFGTYVFGEAIGIKAEAVHYKNTGDALAGIMSGDVAAAFASVGLSMPQVKGGKMIAIGSTGPRRSPSIPDLPTFAEQGYPQVRFSSWYGIVAPAGTPADIVAKLEADVRRAALSEDGKAKMEAAGFGVTATSAAEFARILAADTISWGKAVAATGFKAD